MDEIGRWLACCTIMIENSTSQKINFSLAEFSIIIIGWEIGFKYMLKLILFHSMWVQRSKMNENQWCNAKACFYPKQLNAAVYLFLFMTVGRATVFISITFSMSPMCTAPQIWLGHAAKMWYTDETHPPPSHLHQHILYTHTCTQYMHTYTCTHDLIHTTTHAYIHTYICNTQTAQKQYNKGLSG